MKRLVDLPPGDSTPERAGELIRKLPPAQALSSSARARIASTLAGAGTRPPRRRLWLFAPATLAVAALALLLLRRTPAPPASPAPLATAPAVATPAPRAPLAHEVVLSACGAADIARAGDRTITLEGPGAAVIASDCITLRSGRLIVPAGAHAFTVEAPGARITIPPRGAAQIDVRSGRVIVAASSEPARIEWLSDSRTITLPAGTSTAPMPPPACASPSPPPSRRTSLPAPVPTPPSASTPAAVPAPAPEPPPPPPPPPPSTLAEEAALLSAALRHLRAGDPAACLSSVDEHTHRFRHGALAPEAARLRDRCRVRSSPPPSQVDETRRTP